jgi:hypothetical protein
MYIYSFELSTVDRVCETPQLRTKSLFAGRKVIVLKNIEDFFNGLPVKYLLALANLTIVAKARCGPKWLNKA